MAGAEGQTLCGRLPEDAKAPRLEAATRRKRASKPKRLEPPKRRRDQASKAGSRSAQGGQKCAGFEALRAPGAWAAGAGAKAELNCLFSKKTNLSQLEKSKKGWLLQRRSSAWPKVFAKGAVPGGGLSFPEFPWAEGRVRDHGLGRLEAKRKSMPGSRRSSGKQRRSTPDSIRIESVGAIPPRIPGGCGQPAILQKKAKKRR